MSLTVIKSFKDVGHIVIIKTDYFSWMRYVTQYGNFVIFLMHLFSNLSINLNCIPVVCKWINIRSSLMFHCYRPIPELYLFIYSYIALLYHTIYFDLYQYFAFILPSFMYFHHTATMPYVPSIKNKNILLTVWQTSMLHRHISINLCIIT